MKVFAPNKQYNGFSAGVAFANGVGETDDVRLLGWFRTHGYTMEDSKPSAPESPTPPKPSKMKKPQAGSGEEK